MSLLKLLPDWAVTNKLFRAKLPPGMGKQSFNEEWDDERQTASIEDATLISSEVFRVEGNVWHKPILDIDIPAALVPSTTPGHHHLYLDVNLSHERYMALLTALYHAGIIEYGIVRQFEKFGATTCRLPHIKKEPLPDKGEPTEKSEW